jgi:hypothetical protein
MSCNMRIPRFKRTWRPRSCVPMILRGNKLTRKTDRAFLPLLVVWSICQPWAPPRSLKCKRPHCPCGITQVWQLVPHLPRILSGISPLDPTRAGPKHAAKNKTIALHAGRLRLGMSHAIPGGLSRRQTWIFSRILFFFNGQTPPPKKKSFGENCRFSLQCKGCDSAHRAGMEALSSFSYCLSVFLHTVGFCFGMISHPSPQLSRRARCDCTLALLLSNEIFPNSTTPDSEADTSWPKTKCPTHRHTHQENHTLEPNLCSLLPGTTLWKLPLGHSLKERKPSTAMVYAGTEEWADVQPIPQDDGENPVVPINYSAECKPRATSHAWSLCAFEQAFRFMIHAVGQAATPTACTPSKKKKTKAYTHLCFRDAHICAGG